MGLITKHVLHKDATRNDVQQSGTLKLGHHVHINILCPQLKKSSQKSGFGSFANFAVYQQLHHELDHENLLARIHAGHRF